MSAVAVFILFVICLVIAIPVSISLGIVAVLPGAFDPSFTASASYVIRSMLGGIDSFPLLAVPMFVLAGILMAHGKISQKLFDVFVYFIGKTTRPFFFIWSVFSSRMTTPPPQETIVCFLFCSSISVLLSKLRK